MTPPDGKAEGHDSKHADPCPYGQSDDHAHAIQPQTVSLAPPASFHALVRQVRRGTLWSRAAGLAPMW